MRSAEHVGGALNYSIVYTTSYRYEQPVSEQHNALRVRPTVSSRQRLEGFDLSIDPAARQYEHVDYFGTAVVQFALAAEHDQLSIRAESRVRTEEPAPAPEPDWESLRVPAYREAAAEYLGPLEPPADPERIGELCAEIRNGGPLQTLSAGCSLIPDRFQYRQGVTYVGSTVNDLLAGGAGVCQDFVHLALTMLRHEGIAARYVSGYLFAPNGDSDASAEVHTHAWVEALLPTAEDPVGTWVAADPTNRTLAGADHVKIGHGRAYSDVPPIRGVYRGRTASTMESSVRMTRLAEAERPRR